METQKLHPIAKYLAEERMSQAAFARKLGISQGSVSQWITGTVPANRVLQVAEAAGGRIKPHELRPDIYPDPSWVPPAQEGEIREAG